MNEDMTLATLLDAIAAGVAALDCTGLPEDKRQQIIAAQQAGLRTLRTADLRGVWAERISELESQLAGLAARAREMSAGQS